MRYGKSMGWEMQKIGRKSRLVTYIYLVAIVMGMTLRPLYYHW